MQPEPPTAYDSGSEQPAVNWRKLFVAYAIMIMSVVGLLAASQFYVGRLLGAQEGDAEVINQAGKQRFRSQRIVSRILRLRDDKAQSYALRDALRLDIEAWVEMHNILRGAEQSVHLAPNNTKGIRDAYERMREPFESLRRQALQWTRDDLDGLVVRGALEAQVRYFKVMDRVVFLYARDNRERIDSIHQTELLLAGIAVLVLLLEAWFVFHLLRQTQFASKKLTQLNQELGEFAYVAAHDLKEPIRGIQVLCECLQEDLADKIDEKEMKQVKELSLRAQRMQALVRGLLEYARIGHVDAKMQRVDTDMVARTVLHELVDGKQSYRIEGKLPRIVYSPLRFEQVLRNLVSNAVKHMKRHDGEVVVACKDLGSFWEFSVADNGVGIEKRHYGRIFQIFRTIAKARDPRSTGLGLAIVRKVVTTHGGTIRVDSEPGKGATFYFTVPREAAPHLSAAASESDFGSITMSVRLWRK